MPPAPPPHGVSDRIHGVDSGFAPSSAPIGFWHRGLSAWVGARYKLISVDRGRTFELYDVLDDPGEQRDLAAAQPGRTARMKRELASWQASCERSARGMDY